MLACNTGQLAVAENTDGGVSPISTSEGSQPSVDSTKGGQCCPRDPSPAGCMQLGGTSGASGCVKTCDFYCSTNWRVEKDNNGCEVWRWDTRTPQPGETKYCFAAADAGSECDPPCGINDVCVKDEQVGGMIILPDDNGACPPGRHLEVDICERDPTFACEPKPASCGASLDCACAGTLCTGQSSCGYKCQGTTTSQVNCLCQTP